jgi:hypothetical protein
VAISGTPEVEPRGSNQPPICGESDPSEPDVRFLEAPDESGYTTSRARTTFHLSAMSHAPSNVLVTPMAGDEGASADSPTILRLCPGAGSSSPPSGPLLVISPCRAG